MVSSGNGEQGRVDPQFQMFDETPREEELGVVPYQADAWLVVLQTRECSDRLFRGKFLFRSQGRELRTTDLFVEPSHREVLDRARHFEDHLLHDLIRSLT